METSAISAPLLIGNLFRSNAAAAPDQPAASLDERVLSFARARRGRRIAPRTGSRARRRSRRPRASSGPTRRSRCCRSSSALAKLGAVFAPLNARLGAGEAAPVARLARPRLLVADASAPTPRARRAPRLRARAARRPSAHAPLALTHGRDDAVRRARAARDAIRTCSSSRAAAPGGRRASCSRTAPTTCAASRACSATSPSAPSACSRSSTWPAFTLALAAWQTRGEIALRAHAHAEALLARGRARAARTASTASRSVWARILAADPRATTSRACASSTPAPPRRRSS